MSHTLTKMRKLVFAFLMAITTLTASANDREQQDTNLVPVVVLDIELLGDTTVKSMQAYDENLLAQFSGALRKQLQQQQLFFVLDDPHSLAVINEQSHYNFLHRCNGCELKLAQELGAKKVVVPWVFRMSKLIQTMYVEVRDVETGKVLLHIGRNFRGNTEDSWQHAINRLVTAIKENGESW